MKHMQEPDRKTKSHKTRVGLDETYARTGSKNKTHKTRVALENLR
jgi:hypothetical protein